MSTNEAEEAAIQWLMDHRNLDRSAAANALHYGVANNWFADAEPELRALVVAYKNTMGRDGRRR